MKAYPDEQAGDRDPRIGRGSVGGSEARARIGDDTHPREDLPEFVRVAPLLLHPQGDEIINRAFLPVLDSLERDLVPRTSAEQILVEGAAVGTVFRSLLLAKATAAMENDQAQKTFRYLRSANEAARLLNGAIEALKRLREKSVKLTVETMHVDARPGGGG